MVQDRHLHTSGRASKSKTNGEGVCLRPRLLSSILPTFLIRG